MSSPADDRSGWIAALAAQPDEEARRSLLERSPHLRSREFVEQLHQQVVERALVDLDEAERLSRAAAWLAEALGDDYARALSLRSEGHVLYARSQYGPALDRYRAALALLERQGLEAEVARTLSSSLQSLIYLGRYAEAYDAAARAREIFARRGDRLRLARLDSNLGNILYRQDCYAEALSLYRQAYDAFREIGEPRDVAAALSNLAVCAISLNQFSEALGHYRAARDWCEKHGMPLLVAEADYNIAYLHYLRGEYTRAIELYRTAREHCTRLGDAYHEALCDLDQSEMYLELNLDEEGAEQAARAAERFERLGLGYERAKALTNLALATSALGNSFRALALLRDARAIFVREKNRIWPALIDLYRALVLYRERRVAEARRFCRRALDVFLRFGIPTKAAICELLLARLLLESGDHASARRSCVAALGRLEAVDAPAIAFHVRCVLGRLEEELGNLDGALAEYQSAQQTLETLRSRLPGEEIKIAFLKDKLAVYESLVSISLGKGADEAAHRSAFDLIEKSKSRGLAELIAFHAHALPFRTAPEWAGEVQNLRKDLNWYYHQIDRAPLESRKPSVRHVNALRHEARVREDQLARALSGVRLAGQEFAALQGAGSVPLEAVRAALPDGAAFIEYYQARDVIYGCLLDRRRVRILPLGSAARLRSLLRLLHLQLSKFRLGSRYLDLFAGPLRNAAEAHLRELYGELIAPLRRLIDARHLIIVPHGFLHYLPFHALADGGRFLIDDFTVSYAPSAGIYRLCALKQPRPLSRSLVLGIPDVLAPHILEEVRAAASALPHPRLYIGEDATEERLREEGPLSRFVHIATHGTFRRDNPMFSSIRLGGSRLNLLDLYQLNLPAELVTLSGCSTGLSAVIVGDELVGLVRGLLYAGAHGVLVTLWDVHDRSTAGFMASFYRSLAGTADKAAALRHAILELRDARPHPYYWAPFVLVGKYA